MIIIITIITKVNMILNITIPSLNLGVVVVSLPPEVDLTSLPGPSPGLDTPIGAGRLPGQVHPRLALVSTS